MAKEKAQKTDKNNPSTKLRASRLVLLDAHAIIHRAYHALPEFASSKGEPTGAIYGLATMLMKIITDLKPDYVVACYDLPQKTFRHETYEGYKAGRAKADDALVSQLQKSRDLFKAFNIPIYDMPGFEADDMLGTIVEQVKGQRSKVKGQVDIVIASGDMDTLQLVDDKKVQVFTLKKGITDTVLYDEEKVMERFGFGPELLPDYKGLRGDPSDNIIGIKGIGEKTATTLITTFGTIENMYKKLKGKGQPARTGSARSGGKEKVAEELKKKGITERIMQLLLEGEEEALFSKTLATIRRDAPIDFKMPEKQIMESVDVEEVEKFFREMEFRSLVPRVRVVFGGNPVQASFISQADSALPLADQGKEEIEKYDPEELKKLGIAVWILNSELTTPSGEDILHFTSAKNFPDAKEIILKKIREEKLDFVYEGIELPILPILNEMEKFGVGVDVKYLTKLSTEYHKELGSLEKKIWKLSGREFNINSPKQLGEILFDELKLVPEGSARMKKTAGGARSTRESELEKLREAHPIVDEIFKYREIQKLLSTYIDTLPHLVKEDGRVHAKFHQAGTTTGRFSSSDPNLQNIPIKSELGKNIRNAFVAAKGWKLVSFDYSQIELRMAALLARDEYLTKVFIEGKDVHSAVASKVFGAPEDKVTHEMRRRAKVINFGILYGMGVSALQKNLGTDRKEAQLFYNNYFAQFPKIAGYLDGVKSDAKRLGYTETLFGRRRYFPGIKSSIPFIKAMAERMAINAPVQGTGADVVKLAMAYAHDALGKVGLLDDARLILQVHDELVFEIKEDKVKEATDIIGNAMRNAIPEKFLKGYEPVPIEVHVGVGNNWGETK